MLKKITTSIFIILFSFNSLSGQWINQSSGTTTNLSSVHFINADSGWMVNGRSVVFKTTNGGANWNQQPTGFTNISYDINFAE